MRRRNRHLSRSWDRPLGRGSPNLHRYCMIGVGQNSQSDQLTDWLTMRRSRPWGGTLRRGSPNLHRYDLRGWPKISVGSADWLPNGEETEEVSSIQVLRRATKAWQPQPAQVGVGVGQNLQSDQLTDCSIVRRRRKYHLSRPWGGPLKRGSPNLHRYELRLAKNLSRISWLTAQGWGEGGVFTSPGLETDH